MEGTQEINRLIGKADNLPTLPGIAIKLLQAVQKKSRTSPRLVKSCRTTLLLPSKC